MSRDSVDIAEATAPLQPPPFAPSKLFYGWLMVPVATAGLICTAPGQTFGVSVFLPYIRDSLALSKSEVAGAYMLGTGLAALAMTFVGMAMDRFGLRRTIATVVMMLALGCAVMSVAGGWFTLLAGFLMLRMFGQGSLGMLSGNTLAMWFNRKLGMAMGLMATGMAGAIALVPTFNHYLIQQFGWRNAYLLLGGLVLAIMTPLLAVVFRNRPEDIGQLPDGDAHRHPDDPRPADREPERAFTARQAMATRSYWIAACCFGFFAFSITAVIFCAPSVFESRGFSNDQASQYTARITVAMGGTLLGAQFLAGLLADRLPLNVMLALGTLVLGATTLVLRLPDSHELVYPMGALMGAGQALIVGVGGTIWVRYYGRKHLGKIRGTLMTLFVALSGAGPLLVDGVYELVGSYSGVLLGLAVAPGPLALAALFATRPPPPDE